MPSGSREARAFWTVGEGRGEIRVEPLAAPSEGEVLVLALASGVSRGTELLVHRGLVPESEWERMRAPHQGGALPFPVKYGYSSVGRVTAGAPDLVGRVVFCLHPHQTAYVVPRDAVVEVPASVPPERAVLAANCETALNAVWDARLGAGDRVSVVGAGSVGALVAFVAAKYPGTHVELVDVEPDRAEVAERLGVSFAPPAAAARDRDLVVHASGSPSGLDVALSLAGFEATVLELSWYGNAAVTASLGGAFHSRRLRIQSSQVGHLPAERRARFTHRRRLETAVALLADARLDALFAGDTPFHQMPALFERLSSASGAASPGGVFHRILYDQER